MYYNRILKNERLTRPGDLYVASDFMPTINKPPAQVCGMIAGDNRQRPKYKLRIRQILYVNNQKHGAMQQREVLSGITLYAADSQKRIIPELE